MLYQRSQSHRWICLKSGNVPLYLTPENRIMLKFSFYPLKEIVQQMLDSGKWIKKRGEKKKNQKEKISVKSQHIWDGTGEV